MPNDRPCPSCGGVGTIVDFHSREPRPCIRCKPIAYEVWCEERRPATRRRAILDDLGRCCGRKPIPYKSKGRLFCPRCDANFDIETKQQVANWAWRADGDAFVATYPTMELSRLASEEASHDRE